MERRARRPSRFGMNRPFHCWRQCVQLLVLVHPTWVVATFAPPGYKCLQNTGRSKRQRQPRGCVATAAPIQIRAARTMPPPGHRSNDQPVPWPCAREPTTMASGATSPNPTPLLRKVGGVHVMSKLNLADAGADGRNFHGKGKCMQFDRFDR
ncbi:hypothetical protein H310_11082 [Aphanomyces invadans]|uniref:Uncharacterized protein n=1 Tax=Aphanomyces invadans TaxID=157072 RepID=A0A024TNR2_9STRA|nr:hypothetical protein H310_11082 [Aphanomyces invadans]ETV95663.1 hypothetical protein H310_11082 [Aphanomyces invadans]|eukprot:XP_008875856.1 hypothetical protein H310_11082 [Aphanomyces invadans]